MNTARLTKVGRHGPIAFSLTLTILLFSLLDGVLTLVLIELRHEEANPLMAYLLDRGTLWFLLGKYVLTAVALTVLIILKDRRMFGTGYRVAVLLPTFVVLYAALTAGQLVLLLFHSRDRTLPSSPMSPMMTSARGPR
jgi:hypothetical protein